MKTLLKTSALAGIVISSLFASGCATRCKPSSPYNPPPLEPLSNFTAYELRPVTPGPRASRGWPNNVGVAKIQANLAKDTERLLHDWNQRGAGREGATRTLVIDPEVAVIKHVNVPLRLLTGPFIGNSGVLLRVTLTEKETGKVIAMPEFSRRRNWFTGTMSFGIADNGNLRGVSSLVKKYLANNYNKAAGGPTGGR